MKSLLVFCALIIAVGFAAESSYRPHIARFTNEELLSMGREKLLLIKESLQAELSGALADLKEQTMAYEVLPLTIESEHQQREQAFQEKLFKVSSQSSPQCSFESLMQEMEATRTANDMWREEQWESVQIVSERIVHLKDLKREMEEYLAEITAILQ
jgi:hypothetical protein